MGAVVFGAALAVSGTVLGLLRDRTTVCCMFSVTERRGYPLGWLVRSAGYADLPAAAAPASFASDAVWRVDTPGLVADLVVFGVFGLLLVVGVGVAAGKTGRVGLQRIRQGSFLDSGHA